MATVLATFAAQAAQAKGVRTGIALVVVFDLEADAMHIGGADSGLVRPPTDAERVVLLKQAVAALEGDAPYVVEDREASS